MTPRQRRTHLLLVEKVSDERGEIHRALREAGHHLTIVASAAEARSALDSRFDLAVVDTDLPDASGLELCRTVVEDYGIPVVLRSRDPDDAQRVRGLEAGADAYLIEPLGWEVMVATARTVLRKHQLADRLELAVSVTGVGHWDWDITTGEISWTASLERMHGLEPGTFGGTMEAFVESIHPDERERVQAAIDEALSGSGDTYEIGYEFVRPDGTTGHLAGRARILRGGNGQPRELIGVAVDVTSSVVSARRNDALVEYAGELMGSATLPDGCATIRARGPAAAGADVVDLEWVPAGSDFDHLTVPATGILRSPELRGTGATIPSGLVHISEGQIHHAVVFEGVTMSGTGRIALGWKVQPELDRSDLRFLELFAQQSVSGLRQLSDYEQQRHIASTLQRALLSEAMPVDGVDVVTAYRPAAEAALIGGDWFDVVELADGHVAVVVGDIAGHGIGAAAASAAARHSVRTALLITTGPIEALQLADRVLASGSEPTICTVLVAIVDPARGSTRLASAGHPAPAVRRSDGETSIVDVTAGPPLGYGLWAQAEVETHEVSLDCGDALVAFTDGAVERRSQPLDVGMRELCEEIDDCDDLRQLVERVVSLNDRPLAPADDTVAVALRVASDTGAL